MRSLRARLVVGVVVLVGAALVLVSIVTLAALRSYLFAQVDDQLVAGHHRRRLGDGRRRVQRQ